MRAGGRASSGHAKGTQVSIGLSRQPSRQNERGKIYRERTVNIGEAQRIEGTVQV